MMNISNECHNRTFVGHVLLQTISAYAHRNNIPDFMKHFGLDKNGCNAKVEININGVRVDFLMFLDILEAEYRGQIRVLADKILENKVYCNFEKIMSAMKDQLRDLNIEEEPELQEEKYYYDY
jgi:hypothetical protein